MRRIQWDPLPQLQWFRNCFHTRNESCIETHGNLKSQDQGSMLDVVAVRFLPIPEFVSWLCLEYGVSDCPAARELYLDYLMLGISISNFHELLPAAENEGPNRQHARLEQNPCQSHIQKFHQTQKITCGRSDFFQRWRWEINGGRAIVSRLQGFGNGPIFHHMWNLSWNIYHQWDYRQGYDRYTLHV